MTRHKVMSSRCTKHVVLVPNSNIVNSYWDLALISVFLEPWDNIDNFIFHLKGKLLTHAYGEKAENVAHEGSKNNRIW